MDDNLWVTSWRMVVKPYLILEQKVGIPFAIDTSINNVALCFTSNNTWPILSLDFNGT
jgi:hypothetical protein